MRGLAAVVVLVHHFKISLYKNSFTSGWPETILHPFTAGHEAVMFFFVLSGFVLALPRLAGKTQSYSVFLLRRVLRIYGPYLVALFLAVAGCAIWHGRIGGHDWKDPVTEQSVLQGVLFLGNYDFARYNLAFWSLVYEMRISILFPLVFLMAVRLPRLLFLITVLLLFFLGFQPGGWLSAHLDDRWLVTFEYIAVFMLGIALAKNVQPITVWYQSLAKWQRIAILVLSLLIYNESYRLQATPLWHAGDLPICLGVLGLMIVGLGSRTVGAWLKSKPLRFLGEISYSLYLVHGTVLFTLIALLGHSLRPLAIFPIYVASVILGSWLFYQAVEAPFMRLSHSVKQSKPTVAPILAA